MKNRLMFPLLSLIAVLALAHISVIAQTESTVDAQPPPSATRPRTVTTAPPPPPTAAPQQQPTAVPVVKGGAAVPTPTPPAGGVAAPAVVAPPPVVVPSFAHAPLQPTRTLSLSKARAHIAEAQRQMKSRLVLTSMVPSTSIVTVAALDPDTSKIHLLTLPKQTFLKKDLETVLTTSLGANVRLRVVRANYVNTALIISDLAGKQLTPLSVEYPIEKQGRFKEMAYYTSAHPALLSPEVVKTGQSYVRTMLDLAAKRLHDKGITVAPQIIDIAERLCLVEHVDHDRFRRENRLALYEEIFALYALNELDTYRYSVSTAGAGGMVQMIPWTYRMVRGMHPAVGLNPDFVLGMRNHGNALEAMLLYMRDTWNDLSLNPEVSYALATGIATQPEIMAAGYNSNPARLGLYLRRGGAAWRTLIPRETQMYLQIYKSVESLIPMKARETKEKS